ncbi:MAG: hypothetical protein J6P60_06635 [Lachnospiraceae bacterium]|nr:hypothetical protein [Lachnospiraceae bacterium]
MNKNKLFHNLGLKILAIVTAIILWLIVVNINDPVTSATFSGISVEVLNADVLTSQGQTYEVLDDTDSIAVSVSAKRSILEYINTSNLRATADMRDFNEADGTIRIRVESNRYNNQIDSLKPRTEFLKVEIEDRKSAQFQIDAVVTGTPKEGYVYGGNVQMNQNIVIVSGPESVVSRIVRVGTEVSVEGMSGKVSTNMDLKYYDAKGEQIDESRLSQNINSVDLEVELYATKEIPIHAALTGTPASGYGVSDEVTVDPATVLIAGSSKALRDTETVQIPAEKVNVEGLNESLETTLDITGMLPDGIILADPEYDGKVAVTVPISEFSVKNMEIAKSNIPIQNVPLDLNAVFGTSTETVSFDVTGLEKDLADMTSEDITAFVDVKAYMEDNDLDKIRPVSYMMPVTIRLPEGVSLRVPVNVNVRFEEKG